jgi:rifampin ADP-ribosylating transferase
MHFDISNKIIQLCAKGMEMEVKQPDEAKALFLQAWNKAGNNFEKFTAAHYVARHQSSTKDKLKWDETALKFALQINDSNMQTNYPSLYLNIAKCYEDLKDFENAQKSYETALSYTKNLPDDSYGKMISAGIRNGIQRISEHG